MKDWEVIATNLSRERWDWGCIVSLASEGRDIFVVQAQRDGKRFIVRADKRLTAFRELESAVCKRQAKIKNKEHKTHSHRGSARL